MSAGNRGKYAEDKVRAILKSQESLADFAFHRFPDAHAGSMVSAPADFMFMRDGTMTLLEVKEVAHDFRLPHKNFDPAQVARMRMWRAAGAKANVLIYSSTLQKWRYIGLSFFLNRPTIAENGRPIGSWDLSEHDTFVTKDLKLVLGL